MLSGPTVRAVAVVTSGTGTTSTLSATVPAGAQAGDLLILQASSAYTPGLPAGWVSVDTKASALNWSGLVASRTATAGDAGSTVTVTYSGSFYSALTVIDVMGAATVRASAGAVTTTVANSTTAGPVSVVAGDLAVYAGQYRNNSSPGVVGLAHGVRDGGVAASSDTSTVAGHEDVTADGSLSQTFSYPTGQSMYVGYSAVLDLAPAVVASPSPSVSPSSSPSPSPSPSATGSPGGGPAPAPTSCEPVRGLYPMPTVSPFDPSAWPSPACVAYTYAPAEDRWGRSLLFGAGLLVAVGGLLAGARLWGG